MESRILMERYTTPPGSHPPFGIVYNRCDASGIMPKNRLRGRNIDHLDSAIMIGKQLVHETC
jgi:hypothetical protein